MGCKVSTVVEPSQQYRTAAVHERYCQTRAATLHMRDRFHSYSGDDFVIKDVNTQLDRFKVAGRVFTTGDKKSLLDARDDAFIASLREDLLASAPRYFVYRRDRSENALFQIAVRNHRLHGVRLHVHFVESISGEPCRIGIVGNWRKRSAKIWLKRGEHGRRTIVAEVSRRYGEQELDNQEEYYVSVVPGFDLALVVFLCVILDEQTMEK